MRRYDQLSFLLLLSLGFSALAAASGDSRQAGGTEAALALGPAAHDYDGDGASDLFWRNTSNGSLALWYSANASTSTSLGSVADLKWEVVGDGDFDGDGKVDILWRHATSGANVVWYSASPATRVNLTTVTDAQWKVVAIGDFDGDGASDILWQHSGTRASTIWKRANYATQQSVAAVTDRTWQIMGAGDFDGDGRSDIFWKNYAVLRLVIWFSADVTTVQNLATSRGHPYQGIGDFNGDGKSDLLWYGVGSPFSDMTMYWPGAERYASVIASNQPSQLWGTPAYIGDYDGDSVSDVLGRQQSNDTLIHYVWYGAKAGSGPRLPDVGAYWQVFPKPAPRP